MTIKVLNVREKKDSVRMYLVRTGSKKISKPKEERYPNMRGDRTFIGTQGSGVFKLGIIPPHKMYTFFQTIKKSAEFDKSHYLFSKNNRNWMGVLCIHIIYNRLLTYRYVVDYVLTTNNIPTTFAIWEISTTCL